MSPSVEVLSLDKKPTRLSEDSASGTKNVTFDQDGSVSEEFVAFGEAVQILSEDDETMNYQYTRDLRG